MSKVSNSNNDYGQKSFGVGDGQVYLHRQCMQWKAVFLQGKYFIADPVNVNKLLQIQAQIELQRQLAENDSSQQQKGGSFHSYYDKVQPANQSYVTEVNLQRQKLNDIKIQEELQREEDLYAQRIAQARNKKKEKKKGTKNLVKMGNDKQEFKSVKMQVEKDNLIEPLQQSMMKFQLKINKVSEQGKLIKQQPIQQKEQIKEPIKIQQLKEQIQQQKTNIQPMGNTKVQEKPMGVNSIVNIQINYPPKLSNPQPKQLDQMEGSQAHQFSNFSPTHQIKVEPSILSLNSSAQERINHQIKYQRAGDQFFFQLHSRIDELQQNIGQTKNVNGNKIASPPPKVQHLSPKFKQSVVLINTKNMLKDLNHQLKEIGLVDPEQDSHITSEYIDNLGATKFKQENEKILEEVNQPIINNNIQDNISSPLPKRQNKQLHVQEAFNLVFSPAVKEQKQQQPIQVKSAKKLQNCKINSSLFSHQIVQASPITMPKGVSQERQKLNDQISLLKQVVGQLRMQRIKYQSSSHDKTPDEPTVPISAHKNEQEVEKQQLSHRVNASIFNNFTQSAVSQIHSNQYRSIISKRAISGKIVKNMSPLKMAKIEQQKIADLKQRYITDNAYQLQYKENAIQQQSKERSKQTLQVNIQEAQSIKIPTNSEEASQNIYKQQNSINNFEVVTIKNQVKAKQGDTGTSKDHLMKNNSMKSQLQMQSSMPRPLNRNNRSQPPKFIIEQHDSHQKKYQSNIKRKLINNFQQLQVETKNKYNTISQEKIDPKKRANKQGVLKTIQSKPASFHPDLNKVIFNKADNNLKAKILQNQKLRPQKIGINIMKHNNGNDSKSSKGFRLRRQSQASRQSRASSSIKDGKLSSKGNINKQQNKKMYVPALQSFGYDDQPLSEVKLDNNEFKESKAQTFKIQKRKIQFNFIQVPKFPQTPNTNIKIQEMAELIKKMNNLLNLQLKQGELHRLIMKKYKNCIMLDLPNSQQLKLVWHYNGKIYVGQWNQPAMLKQGQGLQYMPEKYYYKGQFQNGKRHGNGIMVQQSGNIYEGQWEEGEKSGKGKYYDAAIKLNYQGQWKNGKRQGIGYLSIQNQANYEGHFIENYKDGQGTESFSNGDSYRGQYSKGRFHGKGVYIWSSGDIYQGQFYQGCKHGKGLWTSFIGETYQGYYKNDKKCGDGKYKWGNGCFFQGEFQNDKKNGNGLLKYPDGREVRGIWRQGKLIEQFASTRKDDRQDPLKHRKSKVIESITVVKAENKQQKK